MIYSFDGVIQYKAKRKEFGALVEVHPTGPNQFISQHFSAGTGWHDDSNVPDYVTGDHYAQLCDVLNNNEVKRQSSKTSLRPKNRFQLKALGNNAVYINGRLIKASELADFKIPNFYADESPSFFCQRSNGQVVARTVRGEFEAVPEDKSLALNKAHQNTQFHFAIPLPSGFVVTRCQKSYSKVTEFKVLNQNMHTLWGCDAPSQESKEKQLFMLAKSESDWTGMACMSDGRVYGTALLTMCNEAMNQVDGLEGILETVMPLALLRIIRAYYRNPTDHDEALKKVIYAQEEIRAAKQAPGQFHQIHLNLVQILIFDLTNSASFPRQPNKQFFSAPCDARLAATITALIKMRDELGEFNENQVIDYSGVMKRLEEILNPFITELSKKEPYSEYLKKSVVFQKITGYELGHALAQFREACYAMPSAPARKLGSK